MHSRITFLVLTVVLSGSLTAGRMLQQQEDLTAQSESTAKAIIDAHDVINAALANADAHPASTKSLVYARQATRDTTEPWLVDGSTGARKLLQHLSSVFTDRPSKSASEAMSVENHSHSTVQAAGRKLLQHDTNDRGDRITWALSATHDAISKAVDAGASLYSTTRATSAGLYNARLTTRDNQPWDFDSGDRK